MQVAQKIQLTVSDEGHTYFARSPAADAVSDGFTAAESGTVILPGTTEARTLPMGDVAVGAGVFLEVDGPASLTLGPEATLALSPSPNGGTSATLLFEGALVGLTAAATIPGRAVRGRYVVWGESAGDPDAG